MIWVIVKSGSSNGSVNPWVGNKLNRPLAHFGISPILKERQVTGSGPRKTPINHLFLKHAVNMALHATCQAPHFHILPFPVMLLRATQAKMRLRLFDGKKLSRMTMQDRTLDIRVFRDLLQKRPEHNPKLCGGEEVLLAHLR